ncbi:hypothetical protein [Flavihumibacter solisilvae]|uniref:Methyltransferase domain-containing protein n=1 Tax=Flavihumibacter solisilvae TaxID=1349421 RepID=A0A0C1LDP6_9BACT|nr:hypothetical protein [Flavihumibacter solisilvae]KIC93573.1 hypothetical protein OI18_17740 [Flavihumibacter solisilvae]
MQQDGSSLSLTGNDEVTDLPSLAVMPGKAKPVDRISYLCKRATRKNVLYIGSNNNHKLHSKLQELTDKLHRIDNPDSLFHTTDIIQEEKLNYATEAGNWDIIIVDGVLEHSESPLLLLTAIRERFGSLACEIIITVPNVMSINVPFSRNNQSTSGQFYWFSSFSLNRILIKAGYTPLYHDFVTHKPMSSGRFKKLVMKYLVRKPAFRQTLIYTAKF